MNAFTAKGSAAAVAAGVMGAGGDVIVSPTGGDVKGKIAKLGRRIRAGPVATIDVDAPTPSSSTQLEVAPITMYATDFHTLRVRQIVVSGRYICYGLRAGQVRVLSLTTGQRALLKGHTAPVTDILFSGADDVAALVNAPAGATGELLATASSDGSVSIRALTEQVGELQTIDHEILATLRIVDGKGEGAGGIIRLSWNPKCADILALSAGTMIAYVSIEAMRAGYSDEAIPVQLHEAGGDEPPGMMRMHGHEAAVTAIEFSLNGSLLASSSEDGSVKLWDAEGSCVASFEAHGGSPVSSISWMHEGEGAASIVTAGTCGRELRIWQLMAGAGGGGGRCVQTVNFTGDASDVGAEGDEDENFFNHFIVLREKKLVVVGNSHRRNLYTLHFSVSENAEPAFDCFTTFALAHPVLNFTSQCMESDGAATSADGQTVEGQNVKLYCIQTHAIQQYTLDTGLCLPHWGEDADDKDDGPTAGEEEAAAGTAKSSTNERQTKTTAAAANGSTGRTANETQADGQGVDTGSTDSGEVKEKQSKQAKKKARAQSRAQAEKKGEVVAGSADAPGPSIKIKQRPKPNEGGAESVAVKGENSAQNDSSSMPQPELLTPTELMKRAMAAREKIDSEASTGSSEAVAAAVADGENSPTSNPMSSSSGQGGAGGAMDGAVGTGPSADAVTPMANPKVSMPSVADRLQSIESEMSRIYEKNVELESMAKQTKAILKQQHDKDRKATDDVREQTKAIGKAVSEMGALRGAVRKELPEKFASTMGERVDDAVSAGLVRAMGSQLMPMLNSMISEQVSSAIQKIVVPSVNDAVRTSFEHLLVPRVEAGVREMLSQIVQGSVESNISRAEADVSALVDSLRKDVVDMQAKVMQAIDGIPSAVASGAHATGAKRPGVSRSLAEIEQQMADPTLDIKKLVANGKFEEAFVECLNLRDIETTTWLVKYIDAGSVVPKLSQGVLLSLVQQLGTSDLRQEAEVRMEVVQLAAMALEPQDPFLGPHMREILDGVLKNVRQASASILAGAPALVNQSRLLVHVLTSQLSLCAK